MTERNAVRLPKTNIEVLTELMQFSRYGALAQAFILEAIRKQARRTAAADPAVHDSPLLSGKAWVGVASEIRDRLEAHYGAVPPAQPPSRWVMLFAALLAADEITVDDYEADKVRLASSGPDWQPFITTFANQVILLNDQEIELVDEDCGSRSSFVDVEGVSHQLLLQQVVRLPLPPNC